jgi:hypothetical protein
MRSLSPLLSILLSLTIVACSPAENQTPKVEKIASDSRLVLDKAKTVDDAFGQSVTAARQNIDEQTQ